MARRGRPNGIWGAGAADVWAVAGGLGGAQGYANLIHWDGSAWSPVSSGTDDNLYGVWGTGPNDVWAAGASGVEGVIVHYDGTGWTRAFSSTTNAPRAIFAAPDHAWVVGALIYPTFGDESILARDANASWRRVGSAAPGLELFGVWVSRPSDAWAVGDHALLHWDGVSWSQFDAQPPLSLRGVWGVTENAAWTVGLGGNGGLLMQWNGQGWQTEAEGGAELYAVSGSDGSNVWAVGDNATIMRFDPTASSPLSCEQIGGACTAASFACGGHVSDCPCAGSAICCVDLRACGSVEPECCSPSGARFRTACHDGAFVCRGGSVCPLPP
jgi:hypothetical protein